MRALSGARPHLVRALAVVPSPHDRSAACWTTCAAASSAALRDSPAQDLEKNLRALLAAWFDRLDLVLREDFDVQKKLLERAQAKLAELEARVAELEASQVTAAVNGPLACRVSRSRSGGALVVAAVASRALAGIDAPE